MLEFQAGEFIEAYSSVMLLERMMADPHSKPFGDGSALTWQDYIGQVDILRQQCEPLGLNASVIHARRVIILLKQNQLPLEKLTEHVSDLIRRVRDEMFCVCFYRISADKMDCIIIEEPHAWAARPVQMRVKRPPEYFDAAVLRRFPAISRDLREAMRCYVFECCPACIFHLMRATEIAIPKIAKLCGIDDAKPSWGAVLSKAEKITQATKWEQLPDNVRLHRDFIGLVVADMRGLQRSWRNRVSHVEDRIVPASEDFNSQDARDMMISTHAFLRRLAADLPDGY